MMGSIVLIVIEKSIAFFSDFFWSKPDLPGITSGWRQNLDESQCTGTIDSANNAVLSADFKNVIFKMIHWA